MPVPEAGHEVDDGEYVVDLAWPDRRIAVSVEIDDDRDAWLAAHGWTVVPAGRGGGPRGSWREAR